MGKPGDKNGDYYGYDLNSLDQQGNGQGWSMHTMPEDIYYTEADEAANPSPDGTRPSTQPAPETPAPDSDAAKGLMIDQIKLMIEGEQPGTTDDRALQWNNVAAMLNTVQTQMRGQTDQLDGDWESPYAKEQFLLKVGKSLAYLETWRRAAADNSSALTGLATAMREAQSKMRTLWSEYQQAREDGKYDFGDYAANMGKDYLNSFTLGLTGEGKTEEQHMDEIKEEYSQKARNLLSETATAYGPYLSKLGSGRSHKLNPQNSVYHPGAMGLPTPSMPAPPSVPGGLNGPGAFRGAPPPPPGTKPPNSDKLNQFTKNPPPAPRVNTPPTVNTPPVPAATPPVVPTSLVPPSPNGLRTPGAPPTPRLTAPSPGVLNAPSPAPAFNANNLGVLGNGPAFTNGNVPGGATTAPGAFRGGPPGLNGSTLGSNAMGSQFNPPPAPQSNQQKAPQRRKDTPSLNGPQMSGSMNPPPSPGSTERNRPGAQKQGLPPLRPGVEDAFQAPPSSATPSVLGDRKPAASRRNRPGALPPGASKVNPLVDDSIVPPVLANPHHKGPAKTYTEDLAARQRALQERKQRAERERSSEFGHNLPSGSAPVFEGRTAAKDTRDTKREKEASVPTALLGATAAAALDPHAAPARSADKVARDIRRQVEESTEEAWAAQQTPGGPVVEGRTEQEYRAEPKPNVTAKQ
ncbi:WXG100 family type VII secretion target [Allokutzneria oryzae]|uniref:PPE domain-containing protein n=1 Tax=Allokutzneria oryzae TaxID=1378989 RepID=A0ABV6A5V1_9PSEU